MEKKEAATQMSSPACQTCEVSWSYGWVLVLVAIAVFALGSLGIYTVVTQDGLM